MQVVQATRFGGPEVLELVEVSEPVVGGGQVAIDVSTVDVLFLDARLRDGWGGEYFSLRPPYVPGNGVAGWVSAVGEGVDASWLGSQVITRTSETGGYAERVVVPVDGLVRVPEGVDPRTAAALLHDGPTALGLFDNAKVKTGDRVLVTGAGGGLGALLVQLAHAAGAKVVGAARGQKKLTLVRELGADLVVDYSEPDWQKQVGEVDVVFDGVGGEIGRAAFGITARGGWFSAHGAPSGDFTTVPAEEAERRGVTVRGIEQVQFEPEQAVRLAARALAEAAAGRMTPLVGQTFRLADAAAAHAAIESRSVIGKTLLLVG